MRKTPPDGDHDAGVPIDPYTKIAALYDHVGPYLDRPDVEFYVELARHCGGRTLELGCGTGRILIPTARDRIPITGLDGSTAMLEVCRQKMVAAGITLPDPSLDLVRADMRDFDLKDPFSLVTTPFRSFQHLTTIQDQLDCLRCVHRHLQPEGRFVLDVFDPDPTRIECTNFPVQLPDEEPVTLPDGQTLIRSHYLLGHDRPTQCLHLRIDFHVESEPGHRETMSQEFRMRYFFRYEAEHLLERAGFDVLEVYSDYTGTPHRDGERGEIVILARRRA